MTTDTFTAETRKLQISAEEFKPASSALCVPRVSAVKDSVSREAGDRHSPSFAGRCCQPPGGNAPCRVPGALQGAQRARPDHSINDPTPGFGTGVTSRLKTHTLESVHASPQFQSSSPRAPRPRLAACRCPARSVWIVRARGSGSKAARGRPVRAGCSCSAGVTLV